MSENIENGDLPDDIKALSFEAAMAELEDVVRNLESGNVSLDDSIALYTRGALLKRHCEVRLNSAQAKIEKITLSSDGEPTGTAPFDAN